MSLETLTAYLRLAFLLWKRHKMPYRDRLLLLSATGACLLGLHRIAGYCRWLILKNNPGHMIGNWETVHLGLHHEGLHALLKQVERRFSLERIESELAELGFVESNERSTYFSDEEFMASILGVGQKWLRNYFDRDGLFIGVEPGSDDLGQDEPEGMTLR